MTVRLPQETEHLRSGSVALFGWTNVGKSTLLNRLVGDKVAAVADVAQTTRRRIRGVSNLPGRGQIVFVDTPGLHRPRYRLNHAMVETVRGTIQGVDLAALIVDAARGLGPGDREAAELLSRASVRSSVVILNKVDLVRPKSKLLPMMSTVVDEWGLPEVIPVSAHTGDGTDRLIDRLLELLPVAEPPYPEDYLTDLTERDLAAEWIREKVLQVTHDELPHATAVLIEEWKEREDGLVEIHGTILVDRESQKAIVIGKGGEKIKHVGVEARADLERLLGRKVFLDLRVKTQRDWRNDPGVLQRLGLR